MQYALIFSLIFFCLTCRAESDLEKVTQFKIASLQLLSSFSAYIYFEGDDLNKTRLQQAKIHGDEALVNLSDNNADLKLKWQQISAYVEASQGREFDVNLEAGWSILLEELNQIIKQQEVTVNTPNVSISDLSTITKLHVKMESILSRYMAFANSTLGGYGITSQGIPLENEIETVTLGLSKLAEKNAKYVKLSKKWEYIENTLLAYNSNVAPFVVMHTFDNIRKIIANY
jgi:hypothetical protein